MQCLLLNFLSTVLITGASRGIGRAAAKAFAYSGWDLLLLARSEDDLETLVEEISEEINKIQTELISEKDFQKLQNQFESSFVNSNSTIEGIANSLAAVPSLTLPKIPWHMPATLKSEKIM